MKVVVSARHPRDVAGDAVAVVFRPKARGTYRPPMAAHLPEGFHRFVSRDEDACTWVDLRRSKAKRGLLVSRGTSAPKPGLNGLCGSLDAAQVAHKQAHDARVVGAIVERRCAAAGIRHLVLAPTPDADLVRVLEGLLLRAHAPTAWQDGHEPEGLRKVTICVAADELEVQRERVNACQRTCEATNMARALADLPGNFGSPARFVARAKKELAGRGVKVSTIGAAKAAKLGMGLFCAVERGSNERGRILVMEIDASGDADLPPLVFVGKGVTHDLGGVNLKTAPSVHLLTYDKCGAAAVVGAMRAIADLGLPVNVIGICPLAENALSATAYRPGDVLEAFDGTTVYVQNTDAEGRLMLADCLAWAADKEAGLTVDLATLTGGAHTALGEPMGAMFSNDDDAARIVAAAAESSDDALWPLPIHEIHERDLSHPKADLRNQGYQGGAASSAAAFLRHFASGPWVHVDFAGKGHTEYEREYYGPGATGFGVRLLVDVARGWIEEHA